MYVLTQDGRGFIPCDRIESAFQKLQNCYFIWSANPSTGRCVRLLGAYRDEKQYNEVMAYLMDALVEDHERFQMPKDVTGNQLNIAY